ncbi:MAG TPA: hypothetical protein VFC00_35250 [Micromonosporaceae bacterium]|nr:hypothetical protein [Micromonosporaceae bacterium]
MDLHPEVLAALVRDRNAQLLREAERERLAHSAARAGRRARRGRHTR